MKFNYYDMHTTREERLAYLDGWGLAHAGIKPHFDCKGTVKLSGEARKVRGPVAQLSAAFAAGQNTPCRR